MVQKSARFSLLALLIFVGLWTACGGKQNSNMANAFVAPKPIDEDALVAKIAPLLEPNPQTNYQKERNDLLNFALDNRIDFEETDNGLLYHVVEEGGMPKGKWGKRVQIYYKGYFINGDVFDQKLPPNPPFETFIGNTIHAWNQGLEKIGPGGKIILLAPSHLAYGEEGAGNGLIPPNTPLIFEISFLDFVQNKPAF